MANVTAIRPAPPTLQRNPFDELQAFGTKRVSEANAALIVVSVNYQRHLIETMQRILRTTQRPVDGDCQRLQTRLSLISRYAAAALAARALP